MGANDFGRFNHTLQECREGLARDIAEFGSRYSLVCKALTLLDTSQENRELVRSWYDLYTQVIDETSYIRVCGEMESLEIKILESWYELTHSQK